LNTHEQNKAALYFVRKKTTRLGGGEKRLCHRGRPRAELKSPNAYQAVVYDLRKLGRLIRQPTNHLKEEEAGGEGSACQKDAKEKQTAKRGANSFGGTFGILRRERGRGADSQCLGSSLGLTCVYVTNLHGGSCPCPCQHVRQLQLSDAEK
jgi:hypothetical protein